MKKVLLSGKTGTIAIALLLVCPLLTSPTGAMSVRQVILKTQPVSAHSGTRQSNQNKTTILARNTSHDAAVKAERADETTTTAKPQKSEGKTTVGRCWKRLMNNLREIRHAQKKN